MRYLLFCFFCLGIISAFGQKNIPEDWKTRAGRLYDSERFDEALNLLYPVSEHFKANKRWDEYVDCELLIADNLDELGRGAKAAERLGAARNLLRQFRVEPYPLGVRLLMYQGLYELWSAQYNPALEHLEQAANLYEQAGEIGKNLARCHKNAGQIYVRRLDYANAFRCFDAAEKTDTGKIYTVSIALNRGIGLHFLGDKAGAIKSFRKGLEANPEPDEKAILSANLAECYISAGAGLDAAGQLLQEARSYFIKNPPGDESMVLLYLSFAQLAEAKKQCRDVLHYFNLAQREARQVFTSKHREYAKLWVEMGKYYERRKQAEQALHCYQQALIQVFPNFNEPDWRANPPQASAFVESFGMTAPARKGALLLRMAARQPPDKQLDYLRAAAGAFDLAFAGIQKLYDAYSDETAKLYIGEYVHDYLEDALEVERLLFEKTGSNAHLERFFQLLERNKGGVLAEALQKHKALGAAGIPDNTLKKWYDLRREIAETDAQLAGLPPGAEERHALSGRLDSLKTSNLRFIENLGRQHPLFDRYNTRPPAPVLSEIMQALQPGQALLEYFEGKKAFYLILIQNEHTGVHRIAKTGELMADIYKLLLLFKESAAIESAPNVFFKLSYKIWEALCPLPDGLNALTIIPDGVIAFLPFASFITQPYQNGSFSAAPFLIKETKIGHSWSAGLWLASVRSPCPYASGKRFIQLAPEFPNNERGLVALNHSAQETAQFRFEPFFRQQASAGGFTTIIQQPLQILHLSTHGYTSGKPGIEFYDRQMSLNELFGFRLRAALVVLSACETGLGQVETGEGVINFTYGFAYAGASSVITSLWKINDLSTALILRDFYKNLASTGRMRALQKAQQAYLVSDIPEYEKSPYYWAGLNFYGQDGPVRQESNWWKQSAIGLLTLAVIILLVLLRRKKTSVGASPDGIQ